MPKFFVDKSQIFGNFIEIKGIDANHIVNVLRMSENDKIIVCDGNGTDYSCFISELSKNYVKASIAESHKNENEPNIKITLFQGIPKSDKMELVIQKCVEIGVDKIVPVMTEHTVVKLNGKEDKKLQRWNKIAEAAAKQCGRGKIPIVEPIINFKQSVLEAKKLDNAVIPYECENKMNMKDFINKFNGESVGIIIGPEGGFSESEINFAKENNIPSVTLGKRILRTETAGLVTSVILLYELENV